MLSQTHSKLVTLSDGTNNKGQVLPEGQGQEGGQVLPPEERVLVVETREDVTEGEECLPLCPCCVLTPEASVHNKVELEY